jgi:hypothetical protein
MSESYKGVAGNSMTTLLTRHHHKQRTDKKVAMDKVCIFCGQPPQDKNKEHIIPKWLMKLTDTENKSMIVGIDYNKMQPIQFNFSSFTFPSCTKCNSDFAAIEALVRPTVEKILVDDYVDGVELIRLLDWFDKVRISLWIAIQFLNKGTFNMDPKYFVNTRVGLKDRLLAITNCYDSYKGLRWTGANTLCFVLSPTCLTLKVNNVLFTNCSSDFVLSEQLGFPYPVFERPNPNSSLTDFQLVDGKNRASHKLFNSKLYSPTTIVSQPIFSIGKSLTETLYNNDYVKANSYDYSKGQGKLFVTDGTQTYAMEIDGKISFASSQTTKPKLYKLNRPTLELQIELLQSKKYNLKLLDREQQQAHHENLEAIVAYTKKQIEQYDY